MSKKTVIGSCVSLSAFAAALAFAAPAHAEDDKDTAEIVVTAQRNNQTQVIHGASLGVLGDQDAMSTPFAVKSYSDTLILNQQPQSLGEVLDNDASVRTSLGFGNASEQYVMRGFTLYGEDIAIDGLFGVTPRQLISPELYDQVQILSGASAFLFGAAPGGSALGGTVNLLPKRAKDKPTNRVTANYVSDSHFGGAFDFGRRFGAGGEFGVRINGAYRAGDRSIGNEFRSSAVLGAGFDFRTDRFRASLDVAYQRVKVRNMRPQVQIGFGVSSVPDVPASDANYGQPWNYTTLRDVFGIFKAEYDLADDVTLYGSVGARDSAERGKYQGFTVDNAVNPGDAYVTGSIIPRNDNNEAGQVGIRAKFKTGPISHQVNIGGSHIRQVNRNAYAFGTFGRNPATGFFADPDPTYDNGTNLYNPVTISEPSFTVFASGNLADPLPATRIRESSVFGSDTLGLFDDKFLITLGLRRQNIYIRTFNNNTGGLATSYNKSATTPVVGLLLRPTQHISFYANRIDALVQAPTPSSDSVNANEVFPPYKATQYELGVKASVGRWNASAAVFTTSQPQGLQNPVTRVYALNGENRNQGIEINFDGEPVKGLRLIAGVSIIDAKQKKTQGGIFDGNDAIGVPKYMANANVEWDLGFVPGVTLTGRVIQTGAQYADLANNLRLNEWTRLDVGGRYVFPVDSIPLTLRFNVDNIADKRYWASAQGGYLVQGLPRTYKVSATIEF